MPSASSRSSSSSMRSSTSSTRPGRGAGVDRERPGVAERGVRRVHGVREARGPRGSPGTAGSTSRRRAPGSAPRARSGPGRCGRGCGSRGARWACSVGRRSAASGRVADDRWRALARSQLAAAGPKPRVDRADDRVVLDVARRPPPRSPAGRTARRRTPRCRRARSPRPCRSCPSLAARAGARGTAPRRRACARGRRACRRPCGSLRGSPAARPRPRRRGAPAAVSTSARMSRPSSTCRLGSRVTYAVCSCAVNAFMSPPTDSIASAISRAERVLGALEQQVLEEVRDAAQRLGLVARADADPDADADRAGLGHPLGDDAEARGQLGALDAMTAQRRSAAAAHRRCDRGPTTTVATAVVAARPPPVGLPPRRDRGRRTASRASASKESSNDTTSPRRSPPSRARCRTTAAHGRAADRRSPPPPPALVAVADRATRRELAVRVDVVDPHLDLVAEVEHVLDPVDALAAARASRCGAGRRGPGGC